MAKTPPETAIPDVSVDDVHCYCHLDGIMDIVNRKYAIQVICLVGVLQPVRYAEIEDTLPDVSSSTLATRLDELTQAGLLHRERYAEIPPRVEYRITEKGVELCELLDPLLQWANEYDISEHAR